MWTWLQKRKSNPGPSRVEVAVDYPSGLAVSTGEVVYFIKGRSKFKVFSDRVVESWSFNPVPGSEESLKRFKRVGTLGFRDGTLIKNFADGKTYLISDNKRRHIENPDIFPKFGLDESRVLVVSQEETNLHDEGEVLL